MVTVTLIPANTWFEVLATDTKSTLAHVRALGLNTAVIATTIIARMKSTIEIAIRTNAALQAGAIAVAWKSKTTATRLPIQLATNKQFA